MSKQRYIQDSFWTDPYIEKLSPDEKLIFLHLLTNPQCNIAGVYEVRAKRIAYETGYDVEVIENILKRFVRDSKLIIYKDWVIIVNHLKNQSLGGDTAKGINRIIKESPIEVQNMFELQVITNTKGDDYDVMVIKSIGPLQAPYRPPTLGRIVRDIVKDKVKDKVRFGEFKNVLLKDDEYLKLTEKIGDNNTKLLIEELSGYLESTKKKYASHYATLLNWARRRYQNHQEKLQTKKRYIA